MRLLAVLMLCTLAFAYGCGDADDPEPRSGAAASGLPVIELRYDGGSLRVEVASTASERAVGLSNRDALGEREGMLFDLGETRVPSFWMKDTRIPLDMIWIDEDKRVIEIDADVQPQPGVPDDQMAWYGPSTAVRWALELNGGAAARFDITPGEILEFTWSTPDGT